MSNYQRYFDPEAFISSGRTLADENESYRDWRKKIERDYAGMRLRQRELKQLIDSFVVEITADDPDWVQERRLEFLRAEKIKADEIKKKLEEVIKTCQGKIYQWFGEMAAEEYLKPLVKEYRKLDLEIRRWNREVDINRDQITAEDIENARMFDIGNLVTIVRDENNRGWAYCPWHEEKHPSFCWYKKSNSFYTFCCNKGGDVISLYQELRKISFLDAVKDLLGIR